MSAHRRTVPARTKLRRTATAAVLAVTAGIGSLVAAGPANAAGPWFVAASGGNNANSCLVAASPCATIAGVLAKGGFVDGDTINLAAGTYTERPAFAAKTANLVGAGSPATTFNGSAAASVFTVNITAAKTLKLSNMRITNGRAANGGGIAITSGQVQTTNVDIIGNAATNAGGGVVNLSANGSLTMTGGSLASNTAAVFGGGVYSGAGTISLAGTSVAQNSAQGGGGIYAQAGAVNLSNATVSSNSATGAGLGGGIASAAAVNVSGGSFTSNSSVVDGGAIYNNSGSVTTNGTTFTGNTAVRQGGAIIQIAGTTTLTGSTISGSSAGLGGAIANGGINGSALSNGGTVTIDGGTLSGNTANGGTSTNLGNGGAIYNGGAVVVKNGATFSGNKVVANTNATPGITGYGGAIASFALTSTAAPSLTFTNATINGDNAGTPVAGGNAVVGGAIAAAGNIGAGGAATTIAATGLTLSKNVALGGGGIYSTGPVSLTDSTVTQNKATHASAGLGGGIYATPQAGTTPTLTLDNTKVTGNDGVAGGGGIVTTINTVVKNGSKVNANTGAIGAGIYTAAPLSVTGSEVNDNDAGNSGGGIYTGAAATITDSQLNGNTAVFLGGAFSTTAAAGSLTMTGGTMSDNVAFAAGGAFIGNSLNASFDDTDLIGNTSTGGNFGGGAIFSAGQLTINKAQISGNKADGSSGNGGAIFSGTDDENVTTSLKITNSTLSDNEAFAGAAILTGSNKASSTNKTSISNSTIDGNAASGPFGVLSFSNPTSIVASTITDNTAVPVDPFDAYGGIVAKSAGLVSVSGSILSGNNGHQCNVAVADGGSNLNSPTASECAFSTAGSKGNVFAAPQLGALANNGGPTTTRLPGATSPALNKITTSAATGVNDAITGSAITLCTGSDQRGTSRPQGAKCDIGAVEAEQVVPVISGPSSATYAVGVAGAPQSFTTTGSPQPTLSATGLPNGVTFTDNGDGTGTLAGTPGAGTGGVHEVTVKATNEAGTDTKTFTLTINQAPALAGPSAATYVVGQSGGPTVFTTTGHPTSVLSSLGLLPGGVTFTDNGDGTGAYAGTPSAGSGGVYGLTVKAANGTAPDATKPFTLTVNEAPSLTGPGSATFKVGTSSQSNEFVGSGFPVPSLSALGLPAGLSLASTGAGKAKITGSAANGTGGLYPGVVVKATNGVGSDATKSVDVTVNEAPELVGPSEARFVTGTAGSIGFSSDGYPTATITKTGSLPAGLTFTDNGNGSATISGTAPASAVGEYPITIKASNGQSPDATINLVLEVVPPLSISTTSLPNAAYKTAYSAQVTASGGQPAYSFEIVGGALPAGLSMNQFGTITGSATAASGTFTFTVKATDSLDPAQTATKQLSITLVKGSTTLDLTAILAGIQPNGDLSINAGLVEADIRGGFPLQPVAGLSVKFTSNGKTVCTGVSDAAGHAQCSQNVLDAILTPVRNQLTATFAGNALWNGATASAGTLQPGSSGSGGGCNLLAALLGGC
ncbi:hypothetical protein ABIE44_001575 [Marmoricola sp. OAE513]|uniref:beta strand repeat-containing protein n=1 Tax=Marmoricola sp. OAE513 TaxID=2817894 RepID=UPI001AEB8CCC